MLDTLVVATDGSGSVRRAVDATLDLAGRFAATVHALYVIDESRVDSLPDRIQGDVRRALDDQGQTALQEIEAANGHRATPVDLETAVRVGRPATEIVSYVREVDADAVAMGTRGRSGEHSYLLGSVAERVVRSCPEPVLTVRQLEA